MDDPSHSPEGPCRGEDLKDDILRGPSAFPLFHISELRIMTPLYSGWCHDRPSLGYTTTDLIAAASQVLLEGGYRQINGQFPEWSTPTSRLFEDQYSVVGIAISDMHGLCEPGQTSKLFLSMLYPAMLAAKSRSHGMGSGTFDAGARAFRE